MSDRTTVRCCVAVGGALMLALAPLTSRGENPIIKGIYTADPSAHVFEGKMYLYPSHDRDDSKTWDMTDWHVYSSTDLVSWTDHGVILAIKDIPFARQLAFAPDCGFKNGKYYFYFPVSSETNDVKLTDRIGVAISDSPTGPFKCHPTPIISGRPMGFDPCIFIDDDGSSYIVSGFKTCFITKLKDNMVEAAEQPKRIAGATNFFEGVWMHKYNGKYYLSYSGRKKLCYAIGDSPYGPFQYKGEIVNNGQIKDMSNTTHHSIVQYRGKWYMFYHNRHLAKVNKAEPSEYKRSVCIDELFYSPDGTIVPLKPTAEGVKALLTLSTISTAANTAAAPSLKKGDRIVFLGDSITAGAVGPQGFITLIQYALDTDHKDLGIETIGAGISGNKVPNLQARLERDVLSKKPTIVFIYIGINDVWHWKKNKDGVLAGGTPKDRFESGLKEIIGKIKDVGARPILCTASIIGEKTDGSNEYDKMLDEYCDISRKVAADTKIEMVDLRKAFIEYLKANSNGTRPKGGILAGDGVHLNAQGNKLVAEEMIKALSGQYPARAACAPASL